MELDREVVRRQFLRPEDLAFGEHGGGHNILQIAVIGEDGERLAATRKLTTKILTVEMMDRSSLSCI